eukprot:scaffold10253_cov124-Isochrysis_galbana.AAC.21
MPPRPPLPKAATLLMWKGLRTWPPGVAARPHAYGGTEASGASGGVDFKRRHRGGAGSPRAVEHLLAPVFVRAGKNDEAAYRALGTAESRLVDNLAVRGLVWLIPGVRAQGAELLPLGRVEFHTSGAWRGAGYAHVPSVCRKAISSPRKRPDRRAAKEGVRESAGLARVITPRMDGHA